MLYTDKEILASKELYNLVSSIYSLGHEADLDKRQREVGGLLELVSSRILKTDQKVVLYKDSQKGLYNFDIGLTREGLKRIQYAWRDPNKFTYRGVERHHLHRLFTEEYISAIIKSVNSIPSSSISNKGNMETFKEALLQVQAIVTSKTTKFLRIVKLENSIYLPTSSDIIFREASLGEVPIKLNNLALLVNYYSDNGQVELMLDKNINETDLIKTNTYYRNFTPLVGGLHDYREFESYMRLSDSKTHEEIMAVLQKLKLELEVYVNNALKLYEDFIKTYEVFNIAKTL